MSAPKIDTTLRAVSLLMRTQNANDRSALARYGTYPVAEADISFPISGGTLLGRMYNPVGAARPAHLMVVHGVNHFGRNDPRLIAFARTLAACGAQVFTPELPDHTDYRVTAASIDLIGVAARQFSQLSGTPVGILGISFSGTLSLLAAADPHNAGSISFVVAMGSHSSMHRIARFFVTGETPRIDGTVGFVKPDPYGSWVLLYTYPEELFPGDDPAQVRESLRGLLWDDLAASQKAAEKLSPSGRAIMDHLYAREPESLQPQLLKTVEDHASEMDVVSADNRLASLRVPVLLLHAGFDDTIPNTELAWLARSVPRKCLRAALITPLLSHLDIAGKPSTSDKWKLVQFMAAVLDLANQTRAKRRAASLW